jgi:hydroxymethylglutaryl-CoA lyase
VQAAHPAVVFSYLVPNIKGLERAHAIGAREVAVFLATSEQFSKANINQTVEESFVAIAPVVKQALQYGMRVRGYLSNIFGYDDLPFSPARVADLSKRLLDMGCYEVSLGDTTGIGTAQQTQLLLDILAAHSLPMARIAMHFHDTFGTAIANVKTSYAFGIRTFDASVGGLGGCPYANSPKGNLAMEDLVAWCAGEGIACDVSDAAYSSPSSLIRSAHVDLDAPVATFRPAPCSDSLAAPVNCSWAMPLRAAQLGLVAPEENGIASEFAIPHSKLS